MVARIRLHLTALGIVLLVLGAAPQAQAWEGTVVRVLDGDSFRVRQGSRVETIRLYGVDAPEYNQAGGQAAKKLTKALVRGGQVTIAPMDTDRYGRIVALAQSHGVLVNAELVRAGLAWVYPQYCRAQPLCRNMEALQTEARQRQVGFWREPNPVPPWIWKRQQR